MMLARIPGAVLATKLNTTEQTKEVGTIPKQLNLVLAPNFAE